MTELKLQQCRLDGRYDILDCLHRGGYAEIYVARDLAATDGASQKVVIKALNVHLQGMPDTGLERTLIENFQNEAMALDRVRHPNIISRLGHGTAIDLTKTETRVLRIFAAAPNEAIERSRLQKEIWEDEGVIVGRSLDMFISKLRKKLECDIEVQPKAWPPMHTPVLS